MVSGVLLTGVVLYALIHWAHALLTEVRWINSAETETATQLRACVLSGGCDEYPVECPPGETCTDMVDLPVGTNDVWIHAATDDPASWSGPSNLLSKTVVAPAGCVWDLDGNGAVTTADFAVFLPLFTVNVYFTADFAGFLGALGTQCE